METLPLAHQYRWKDNICQKQMGLSEVLLVTRYRNTLRSWWEYCGNPERLESKESDATSVHVVPSHWLHVTFYFQSQWSPFSNLANTLAMNCGILNPNLPPPPREDPSLHEAASHWVHANSIPQTGCHYFWPGLIALPMNTLPIWFDFWLWQRY